jgi:cellobiose phosphorylase
VRCGHFDDDRRQYVITRPDTPLLWINYLGTDAFFGVISNTAGGYSCYRDARLRRITRYRYNSVPADTGGRYIYLRDDSCGEYWSPSWQPTQRELDHYECRHGLSYTQITSSFLGVRAEVLYFVPPEETLEVWRVRVCNERDVPASMSVFSSVEFCLWDAQDDATNFQRNYSTGEVEVADGVICHRTEYRERRDHFAYFACSEPLAAVSHGRADWNDCLNLPAGWAGFGGTRHFRGATYEISVHNSGGSGGSVTHVLVDGEPIEGTLVPPAPPGATVRSRRSS